MQMNNEKAEGEPVKRTTWRVIAGLTALVLLAGCDGSDHVDPVASDLALTFDEDALAVGEFPATDADGDRIHIEVLTVPAHGSLNVDGVDFSYTPAAHYHGTDSFTYRARDVFGRSQPATVSFVVRPVNDAPFADPIRATVAEDQSVTFTVSMHDVDGDRPALVIPAAAAPGGTVQLLDAIAGTIRFTPDPDYNGVSIFDVEIHDAATFSTASARIDISPVNDAPVAHDDLLRTTHGVAIGYNAAYNDTDVDGDFLRVRSVGTSAGGQLTFSGSGITFTPNPGFLGTVTVAYEIEDAAGVTSSASATFEVALLSPLYFLADRDTPNRQELYRYDGLAVTRISLPLAANERIVDFKTIPGNVAYRTLEGSTIRLYLMPSAPPGQQAFTLVSTRSVDQYFFVGTSSLYYTAGPELYRASASVEQLAYAAALPGESLTTVIQSSALPQSIFIGTVQFNPALGSSSLRRLPLIGPSDTYAPLLTLQGPDSVAGPILSLTQFPASQRVVYSAQIGGSRAIYSIGFAGNDVTRLSPTFGINETFSNVQAHPFDASILYRANQGSSTSDVFLVDLGQPGTHMRLNGRSNPSQELGQFAVDASWQSLYYILSDGSGRNRRVLRTPTSAPGTAGIPMTGDQSGLFGAYEFVLDPVNGGLIYLEADTGAGPSRWLLAPLAQPGAPVILRAAGTTLEQLTLSSRFDAVAVLERSAGNSLLLADLLAPGFVVRVHQPEPGSAGVTVAAFE
jgi:hypothetical protein